MKKAIDITGRKFGKLTALNLSYVRYYSSVKREVWEFECECGERIFAFRHRVMQGEKTDCGCGRREKAAEKYRGGERDITGQRFGRLTALGYDHYTKHGAYFRFRCDCGKECVKRWYKVVNGQVRSCGCLRDEKARERMPEVQRRGREMQHGTVL